MVREYTPSDLLKRGESENFPVQPPKIPAVYLTRNFLGRRVQVLPTPTLIHDTHRPQNIMITNPAPSAASGFLTSTGLHTTQVTAIAGNTQLLPLGVANFLNMHLLLSITNIGAANTWSFWNQIQVPTTLVWTDSQVLAAGVTPAVVATWTGATLYANLGAFGVGSSYALRWTHDVGALPITFTLSYILKFGLSGSPTGVSQVIYIGSTPGVQVQSGYPILEGEEKVFQVAENTQIWGIANIASPIRIFELT